MVKQVNYRCLIIAVRHVPSNFNVYDPYTMRYMRNRTHVMTVDTTAYNASLGHI